MRYLWMTDWYFIIQLAQSLQKRQKQFNPDSNSKSTPERNTKLNQSFSSESRSDSKVSAFSSHSTNSLCLWKLMFTDNQRSGTKSTELIYLPRLQGWQLFQLIVINRVSRFERKKVQFSPPTFHFGKRPMKRCRRHSRR